MMEAIGIKIKGMNPEVPVLIYATKEKKFKYRTTTPVKKQKKVGGEAEEIHHSLSFSTVEEAVGSACRFIKKTWNVDVEDLPEDQFSFEKMEVAERVVAKIPPKIGSKLSAFISDMDKDDEVAAVEEEDNAVQDEPTEDVMVEMKVDAMEQEAEADNSSDLM